MAQIPGSPRLDQYLAAAGQTVFIYTYEVYTDEEIVVSVNDTELILTTDYTVQDAGNPSGGTITLVVPATLDDVITLVGNTIIERETTFTNGGDFLASAINGEYDRLDTITNELVTTTNNVFKLKTPSVVISTDVPAPLAGKCLKWNVTEDALELSEFDPDNQTGDAKEWAEKAEISAEEALASALAADASAIESEDSAIDSAASALASANSAIEAQYWADSINLEQIDVDLVPTLDNAYDVGTPAKNWAELHTVDAYVYDDLEVGDDIRLGGNIFATSGIVDAQGIYIGTFPDWDFEVSTLGKTIVGTHGFEVIGGAEVGTTLDVTGNTTIDGTLTVGGVLVEKPKKARFSYTTGSATGGGSSTADSWQTRPLNTTEFDDIGCTLAGNSITLPAGTYDIAFDLQNYNCGTIAIALYSIGIGTIHDWTGPLSTEASSVHCECRFTLAAEADVYITQIQSVSQPTIGLGRAHGRATHFNVYTNILLEKI